MPEAHDIVNNVNGNGNIVVDLNTSNPIQSDE